MGTKILPSLFFILFLTSVITTSGQEKVSIYPQPGSPLQLSNPVPSWRTMVNPEGRELNMLVVDFVSENTSSKTISAYTLRIFTGEFNTDRGGVIFSYAFENTGLIKPAQSRSENIGEYGYDEKSKSIKIAVDFVEFTDGTTWGKDLSDSAQFLAGIRAGTKAVQEHLQKISRQRGLDAVIKALDENSEIQMPENQSGNWKKGFETGIKTTKDQIKRVFERDGKKAFEAELARPSIL